MLFTISLSLSIYSIIPVTGMSEQTKLIPSSGTIRGQNFTEWGTHVWYHSDPDFQMSRVKDLGVKWIRVEWFPPVEWRGLDYFDRVMAAVEKYGLEPMVLINEPSERSPTMTPAEYGELVETLVTQYNLSIVELMNEPGIFYGGGGGTRGTYIELIHAGYDAAKRANPDCVVIAPFGMMSGPWECRPDELFEYWNLWNLYNLGLLNYVDGLVIHPYTFENDPDVWSGIWNTTANPPYILPIGIGGAIDFLREQLTDMGYPDMPLWATEYGYGTDGVYQDIFPEWLVRESEILLEKDIRVSIQYCFWLTEGESNYAMTLVNNDATLSWKPMGTAYKEFIAAQ